MVPECRAPALKLPLIAEPDALASLTRVYIREDLDEAMRWHLKCGHVSMKSLKRMNIKALDGKSSRILSDARVALKVTYIGYPIRICICRASLSTNLVSSLQLTIWTPMHAHLGAIGTQSSLKIMPQDTDGCLRCQRRRERIKLYPKSF